MDRSALKNCMFQAAEGAGLRVVVQPRSGRSELGDVLGDRLKVRVRAAPVGGKANKELERFLAKLLGVPGVNVQIRSGSTGRRKDVLLLGVTLDQLSAKLADIANP